MKEEEEKKKGSTEPLKPVIGLRDRTGLSLISRRLQSISLQTVKRIRTQS